MYCSKCGTEINDNAQFCQHCGNKLFSESNERKTLVSPINYISKIDEHIQRWGISIILATTIFTPFYKIFYIPVLELFSTSFFNENGIYSNIKFSVFQGFRIINNLNSDPDIDVSGFFMFLIIYFLLIILSFAFGIAMINKFCHNANNKNDFWKYSFNANILMTVANIILIIVKMAINKGVNNELKEYSQTALAIDFLDISFVIYIIIAINILLSIYSKKRDNEIRKQ